MTTIADLIGLMGNAGNALGIQGDNPGGLNGLQRMVPNQPEVQAQGLATLATNKDFQAADPATRQAMIQQVAPSAAQAQAASTAKSASALPDNPRDMIPAAIHSGLMTPAEGMTTYSNPNFQVGAVNQVPASTTQQPSNQNLSSPLQTPLNGNQQQKSSSINYDYLNQVKAVAPNVGTMAENMIKGVFKAEMGKGENDPVYNKALEVARNADPSFTPQALIGRPLMIQNATNGKMYNDQMNMNSVVGHMYDVNEAIPRLSSGSVNQNQHGTWYNGIANWAAEGLATKGNEGLQQFKQVRDLASEELAKFYGGGTSSDASRKTAHDAFDENQQGDVLKNQVQKTLGMVGSRATAAQQEYDQTMGNAGTLKIVHPVSEALIKDIQGQPLTIGEQQLVNQHRAASNMPPKAWGKDKTIIGGSPEPVKMPAAPATPKIISQDNLAALAQKRNLSIEQVTKDAKAKGYTVQ